MTIQGGCFCGGVQYQIDGELFDARSCHCSQCRKAFNAQASAYALVNSAEFRWIEGESLLSSYSSQAGFGLQFCSNCGSTLCGIYQGEVHGVTLGCVNGEPKVKIERHIHVGSKANWEVMPDNVLQYEQGEP